MIERAAVIQECIDSMNERNGNLTALAEKLEITAQAISQWKRIPAHRVIQIEAITGISRSRLRPDLYPPEIAAAS